MSTVLKFRRGDTTASNAFTGAEGELFVDTTKDTLVVHDGVTAGGKPLATESYVTTQIGNLSLFSGSYNDLTNKPTSFNNLTLSSETHITGWIRDGFGNVLSSGNNSFLTTDGNSVIWQSIKTINGQSLLGTGDITISGGSGGIALTDLSVHVNSPGSAANLSYNNTTGVFTFTPDGMFLKQDTLVSGTNIKTINGYSLLGSGNITISGGSGGSSLVYGQFADNEIDLTTTTANQVIDSYPASLYRSSKYIIQAVCSGVGIHSTEVMVLHDGTNVYITEYATIFTDTSLFTVDASISGTGDMELTVTPVNANTSFDVVRTSLAARTYEAPSLQGDLMTLSGSEDLQSASGSVDLNA